MYTNKKIKVENRSQKIKKIEDKISDKLKANNKGNTKKICDSRDSNKQIKLIIKGYIVFKVSNMTLKGGHFSKQNDIIFSFK